MRAQITVRLKADVLDPQGKAIEGALRALGIAGVASVRQGKVFDVEIAAPDRAAAEKTLNQMCERLLANPVIESYQLDLTESTDKPILDEKIHQRHFDEMIRSNYGSVKEASKCSILFGVYSFFDGDLPVYVGRTNKRGLGPRMRNHLNLSHNQGVLAFKIARQSLGLVASYSGDRTRENLMKNEEFLDEFRRAIEYVSKLSVKFVEITSSDEQFIFEYYASKRLGTLNNDFDTH